MQVLVLSQRQGVQVQACPAARLCPEIADEGQSPRPNTHTEKALHPLARCRSSRRTLQALLQDTCKAYPSTATGHAGSHPQKPLSANLSDFVLMNLGAGIFNTLPPYQSPQYPLQHISYKLRGTKQGKN